MPDELAAIPTGHARFYPQCSLISEICYQPLLKAGGPADPALSPAAAVD
ncbi:MAG: hypothetical protein ACREPW_04645 [Candidatus Binataceae bacterium]